MVMDPPPLVEYVKLPWYAVSSSVENAKDATVKKKEIPPPPPPPPQEVMNKAENKTNSVFLTMMLSF